MHSAAPQFFISINSGLDIPNLLKLYSVGVDDTIRVHICMSPKPLEQHDILTRTLFLLISKLLK